MALNLGSLRRFVLGTSIEVLDSFWESYQIPHSAARQELRENSLALIQSYNDAVDLGLTPALLQKLEGMERNLQGFAHQGAGMGLRILDFLSPGNQSRFQAFAADCPKHFYVAHIGAGLAMSVLKKDVERPLSAMLPISRWWAMDGFGFYDGSANWKQSLEKQAVPKSAQGYTRRAYDQGLGRSLWFLYHTHLDRLVAHLQRFPESRRADLWSGIGIASTYTSGIDASTLKDLTIAAGDYASYLAVGAVLTAQARHLGENQMEYTDFACSILCGYSTEAAAQLADRIAEELTIDPDESATAEHSIFEVYREKIRQQLMSVSATV